MKNWIGICCVFTIVTSSTAAHAQVPLSGYFIARSECPAYQSFGRQTNPGNVTTRVDHAYDLIGKNNHIASYYLIKIDGEPNTRWVAASCGEHVVPADADKAPGPVTDRSERTQDARYILAVSWQPGFCETRPSKAECLSQTKVRFDASHFTLHGLWPQPRSKVYCDVAPAEVALDENNQWTKLPEPVLEEATRKELNEVMPGTQSLLHRHEWTKHGTCYQGETPDKYYQDSLNLMRELNHSGSAFRALFTDNIGKAVTSSEIRDAFDESFGKGAANKIKIACARDGSRTLITEITIGLQGDLDEISMRDAIIAAPNANNIGCTRGIVDPVGLQ
ncbi:MAG: ribonuclease T2 [Methylococcaceae bacterium]|nr:ribonuclease T2 [Methylococcaceae bacterium]